MTAPKMYVLVFNEIVVETLGDNLIHGTSVEITSFRLLFVEMCRIVRWFCLIYDTRNQDLVLEFETWSCGMN